MAQHLWFQVESVVGHPSPERLVDNQGSPLVSLVQKGGM